MAKQVFACPLDIAPSCFYSEIIIDVIILELKEKLL